MGNIFDPMPPAKKFEPKPNLKKRLEEAKAGVKPPGDADAKDKAMIAADTAKAATKKQQGIGYSTWQCGRCQKATTDIGGMLANGTLVCDDCYGEVYPDDGTFYPKSRFWARCKSCNTRHASGWVPPTDNYRWACEGCGLLNLFEDDGDDGLPVATPAAILSYTGDASRVDSCATSYGGVDGAIGWQPGIVGSVELKIEDEKLYDQFTAWSTREIAGAFGIPPVDHSTSLGPLIENKPHTFTPWFYGGLPTTPVLELDVEAPADVYNPHENYFVAVSCSNKECGYRVHDSVNLCYSCFNKQYRSEE